jgi:hypothetical protein
MPNNILLDETLQAPRDKPSRASEATRTSREGLQPQGVCVWSIMFGPKRRGTQQGWSIGHRLQALRPRVGVGFYSKYTSCRYSCIYFTRGRFNVTFKVVFMFVN